jgi:hypothetical protein
MTKNLLVGAKTLQLILTEATQLCGLYKICSAMFAFFSINYGEFLQPATKKKKKNMQGIGPKPYARPTDYMKTALGQPPARNASLI